MKNILKASLILTVLGAFLFSCAPLDKDDYKLGAPVNESELSFTASPSSSTPNIIVLRNTSSTPGVALWDLGNGTNAKGDEVSVSYPFKGEYTISMSLYTPGGSATISKVVSIADDDYGLLDTPGFNALTGGAAATEGKTWVFARYTRGHFGVGDINAAPEVNGPAWWQCDPNGKDGCSLYDNEFTFIQKGTKLIWKNKGYIYTNENGMNHLGISGTANPVVGDFDVPYVPADNLTFSLDEENMTLNLSGSAFFGFYTGDSLFRIITLTEHEMYVWCGSAAEPGNAWYFILVPKDELKEPEPEPVIPPDPKPEPEEAWFRPNAETNLLRTAFDYESWFSGADWGGGLEPGISVKNNITITVPEGIGGGEWMGQFKIHTHIPAEARERFDFSCNITSSEAGTATVKMTAADDPSDDEFFYNGNVAVDGSTIFEAADHMLNKDTESILLVFDFGRFPAGTVITLSDLCLQKHIPLSEKPEVVNLWPTANILETSYWFSAGDWSGLLTPEFSLLDGNGFELTVPEGIGGSEWMGQFALRSDIKVLNSHRYEFSAKITATAASTITVKITNNPEDDDAHLLNYDNAVNTIEGTVTYRLKDIYPKPQDADAVQIIFDFGRTPAGTKITVTDIVLQEYIQ
ncbi:MAG: PKD domain-containing protein [Bacteroidales bacterium]|nr:PKD domain-containing protein [Bacteroidales bacterium]